MRSQQRPNHNYSSSSLPSSSSSSSPPSLAFDPLSPCVLRAMERRLLREGITETEHRGVCFSLSRTLPRSHSHPDATVFVAAMRGCSLALRDDQDHEGAPTAAVTSSSSSNPRWLSFAPYRAVKVSGSELIVLTAAVAADHAAAAAVSGPIRSEGVRSSPPLLVIRFVGSVYSRHWRFS
jgi:hypothetical protein